MTVEITLTLADPDATTFDLYSNTDSFGVPFESGVPVASLTAGYTTALVPDGTTVIRVQNVSASCSNFIDLILTTTTTTTVSTTTSTTTIASIACDTTTSSGGAGVTEYTLDLEPAGSCIIIDFQAFGVPDKLEILHNGVRVATSGMTVANSGPFDTLYGDPTVPTSGQANTTDQFIGTSKGAINNREVEFLADTGISGVVSTRQQLIWFLYDASDYAINPQVTIRATGPSGTAWTLDRICPPELSLVDVIFNSTDNPTEVWQFNPVTFGETMLFIGDNGSPDVAHTENKLWMLNGTGVELTEYDITLSPFTYSINRTITNVFLDSGLCAIDDVTLVNIDGQDVYTLDITTSVASPTLEFTMLAGRSIAGDYVYTTGGKLIVTTSSTGPIYHITQYDYATGTLEFDLDITSTVTQPYGLYQYDGEVFIASANGDIFNILTEDPYTITLVHTTTFTINGASQIPSQITEEFTSNTTTTTSSTTTTTTTVAPTTTTTTTAAPTFSVVARVNAGGTEVTATDGEMNWANNTTPGGQVGTGYSVNQGTPYDTSTVTWTRGGSIPVGLPEVDFQSLYDTERWNSSSDPNMIFTFSGLTNGTYKMRVYFGESYGAATPGFRVFNLDIQGVVSSDIDPTLDFGGPQVAGMVEFDGIIVGATTLVVEFLPDSENPQVNAIEILKQD